ncbi:MAG: hypothetical protein OEV42_08235 [Deltaproteobacteria bacterium]|nr:hypothetical protein [Deltaproteobacteria bacterium]
MSATILNRSYFNRSYFVSFVLLFLLSHSSSLWGASFSSEQVDSLLENLLRGDYYVSFEAEELTIHFSHGEPQINRFKVGKLKPHKMRREKYAIDGSVEEIIVHDDELQIVSYPKQNIVVRSPRNKTGVRADEKRKLIDLVKKNYDVVFVGNAVISSRPSVIVSINPKDRGSRPSYKVWIDHKTSMPLKTETYSIDGSLSFHSTLSNIVINPSFSQDYFVIMVPGGTVAYEQPPSSSKPQNEEKKLKKLPYFNLGGGYELKESLPHEKGNLQLIYHDGLNMVSIFSEDWNKDKAGFLKKMEASSGGIVERIREKNFEGYYCNRGGENILNFISDKHRYVIVGEVSKKGLVDLAIEFKERVLGK